MNSHEEHILRKTFTECSGCGIKEPTEKDWANITVTISDGRGTKYIPVGKYCARCKDRTWAYRGHGYDNPDWLFTEHELTVAQGLCAENHLDNPEVIKWLEEWLSSEYPKSVTCNLTWAQAYAKIAALQSTITQQAAENERLNAENEQMKSQFAGNVTIVKEKFCSADKEMIEQLRAENERLNARVAELRNALTLCLGAIIEMTPCAADECKQTQTEWKDEAEEVARKALASTDTTWLDRKIAEAKRATLEKVKEVFTDDCPGWWSPNAVIEQIEILEADLKES